VTQAVVRGETGIRACMLAAMSYMGILCFVPLMMNRDDEFIYFHAKQGLVIWIWGVLALFALHLPGFGKWFFSISAVAVIILSVIGVVAVLLRKAWKLPLVHTIASAF
jgi:uncharacterized membrane protein